MSLMEPTKPSYALLREARTTDEDVQLRVLTILNSMEEADEMATELRRRGLTVEVRQAIGSGFRTRVLP